MEKYVVTISRQFGSLGRTIAQRLSEELNIEFWDRDIVEATAKRMGRSIKTISDEEESSKGFFLRKKYWFNMGIYSITDEIFYVQKNIIRDVAAENSCIIVGRCADSILKDYKNHLSVYIYAPFEERVKNCVERLQMDPKEAAKTIREVDAARTNYQKKYCPEVNSVFDHKDLMIDSSKLGVDGAVDLIAHVVRNRYRQFHILPGKNRIPKSWR